MAEDIKIVWQNLDIGLLEGDIVYNNGDLERELGLETAVLMSVYTDARASDDDILPDTLSEDRRGWWGDLTSEIDDDFIGSKLWLLSRASTVEDNIALAQFYIEECLDWMIEDGVAQEIEVFVERQDRPDKSATLAFSIKIYQNDGNTYQTKYYDLWLDQVAA